ncbi:hypothetical protein D920_00782 [Enterococcus faecalis 13-SD-W-01]|nr:hypothetical protein D920_00782 [Enterococcus faecalis 13-SD-W-01]
MDIEKIFKDYEQDVSSKKFYNQLVDLKKHALILDTSEYKSNKGEQDETMGKMMRLYMRPILTIYIDLSNTLYYCYDSKNFHSLEVIFRTLMEHHAQVLFTKNKKGIDFLKLQGWYYSNLLEEKKSTEKLVQYVDGYEEHYELIKQMVSDPIYKRVKEIVKGNKYWYQYFNYNEKKEKPSGVNNLVSNTFGKEFKTMYGTLSRSTHSVDFNAYRREKNYYDILLWIGIEIIKEALKYFRYEFD